MAKFRARKFRAHLMAALIFAFPALAQDAGSVDGGTPGVEQFYGECKPAPPMIQLDGGDLLVPLRRQQRNNCMLAACESYANAKLKEEPSEVKPLTVVGVVGAALTLAIGMFILGYEAPHLGGK